jgi:hypothetical protein
VPHGAKTKDTGCYEVDVFNPPRKTLLDHASAQRAAAGGVAAAGAADPV